MNQAEVSKLMSQLRIAVKPHVKKLRNPEGPEGRLKKLRKTVNALIKHERIELNYPRADEARQYAERVSVVMTLSFRDSLKKSSSFLVDFRGYPAWGPTHSNHEDS